VTAARLPMPAIPLWPPPREQESAAELLDAAEARDPFGHGVHAIAAGLFCGGAGVATSTIEIGAVLLLAIALLRLPHTWRSYAPLLTIGAIPAFLAWIAWAFLTLAWSIDPSEGFGQLDSFRMLLVIPALWPVMRHRRGLVMCLLVGMLVQVVAQALTFSGLVSAQTDGFDRHTGLGSHPGYVTLWLAIAALAAGALLRDASRRLRVALVVTMVLFVVGAFVAGGRGSLLGLFGGAAALLALTVASTRITRGQWIVGLGLTLTVAGSVIALRGEELGKAVTNAQKQIARSESRGDPRGSATYRLYWWGLTVDAWHEHPVIGLGAGSWHDWALTLPETEELAARLKTDPEDLILAHPHSTYLQTLAETGLVGGVLTLLLALSIVGRATAIARTDAIAAGAFAGLVAWAIAAAFEGQHISSRPVGAFAILFAFALLPSLLPRPSAAAHTGPGA
jgi:O-antigen ligase